MTDHPRAAKEIVVLTRPQGRNAALAGRLRQRGWSAYEWPALQVQAEEVDPSLLLRPKPFDLVIFVSGNAVRCYLDQLARAGHPPRWPEGTWAATVGSASAQALRESGWLADQAMLLHPSPPSQTQDSEGLFALLETELPGGFAALPRGALIVRGSQGREWLGGALQAQGVPVSIQAVYRRGAAAWPPEAAGLMQQWAAHDIYPHWVLTSAEGIAAIATVVSELALERWWARCPFVLAHPRLAGYLPSADNAGPSVVKISLANDDALFDAIVAP